MEYAIYIYINIDIYIYIYIYMNGIYVESDLESDMKVYIDGI